MHLAVFSCKLLIFQFSFVSYHFSIFKLHQLFTHAVLIACVEIFFTPNGSSLAWKKKSRKEKNSQQELDLNWFFSRFYEFPWKYYTNIAIKIKPGVQTTHRMTSDILLSVFFIYFQILTDNYFKLNHLVIASFSLLLFRFHCNLLFVTVAL